MGRGRPALGRHRRAEGGGRRAADLPRRDRADAAVLHRHARRPLRLGAGRDPARPRRPRGVADRRQGPVGDRDGDPPRRPAEPGDGRPRVLLPPRPRLDGVAARGRARDVRGGDAPRAARASPTSRTACARSGFPVRDYPDPRGIGDLVRADLLALVDQLYPGRRDARRARAGPDRPGGVRRLAGRQHHRAPRRPGGRRRGGRRGRARRRRLRRAGRRRLDAARRLRRRAPRAAPRRARDLVLRRRPARRGVRARAARLPVPRPRRRRAGGRPARPRPDAARAGLRHAAGGARDRRPAPDRGGGRRRRVAAVPAAGRPTPGGRHAARRDGRMAGPARPRPGRPPAVRRRRSAGSRPRPSCTPTPRASTGRCSSEIAGAQQCANPRQLRTVLDELRQHGDHFTLPQLLQSLLAAGRPRGPRRGRDRPLPARLRARLAGPGGRRAGPARRLPHRPHRGRAARPARRRRAPAAVAAAARGGQPDRRLRRPAARCRSTRCRRPRSAATSPTRPRCTGGSQPCSRAIRARRARSRSCRGSCSPPAIAEQLRALLVDPAFIEAAVRHATPTCWRASGHASRTPPRSAPPPRTRRSRPRRSPARRRS